MPNAVKAKGHVLMVFSIIPTCFSDSKIPHSKITDPMASWLMACFLIPPGWSLESRFSWFSPLSILDRLSTIEW
jgi:hypothetical protein